MKGREFVELDHRIVRPLLVWYEKNKRPLPWRSDQDPYHVWISEIMCQQTRVETVKGYYRRFLQELPTIRHLAACPDDRLSKLWEGLGYYSRAKNLKRAAEIVCNEHGGVFPAEYASIRALPGIGDYTAAAIASICFELPFPAVDGNVLRVVTRLTGSCSNITKESTKSEVRSALRPLFDGVSSSTLNQAFMELGALVCQPNQAPECTACPLREFCFSVGGAWKEIPVKSGQKPRRTEAHTVLLLRCGDTWALRKRAPKGLLAGMWEFPNLPGRLEAQAALDAAAAWGCKPLTLLCRTERNHVFTHLNWELPAWMIACEVRADGFQWASLEEIKSDYSLPTAFRQFVNELVKEHRNEKEDRNG